ncbi:MAG: Sir2 family NAD-dependent protein deacetylase [Planctomycetota bacterium]
MPALNDNYELAAKAIQSAEGLLIAAGAGMGVDSGLPDFRGTERFWKAYPPFRGRKFSDLSTPIWFKSDPKLAWGFFGHRMNLYRTAVPHAGFEILQRWANRMPLGHFVFTSNVDGQFQKAGYSADRILECHGSIHHLQCVTPCCQEIWPSDDVRIVVDEATIRTDSDLPQCRLCRGIARPNILMFHDRGWVADRAEQQERRYRAWLQKVEAARLVIIEIGAGLAVPSVRYESECSEGTLIRINPRESDTPPGGISLPVGGLIALKQINAMIRD